MQGRCGLGPPPRGAGALAKHTPSASASRGHTAAEPSSISISLCFRPLKERLRDPVHLMLITRDVLGLGCSSIRGF